MEGVPSILRPFARHWLLCSSWADLHLIMLLFFFLFFVLLFGSALPSISSQNCLAQNGSDRSTIP